MKRTILLCLFLTGCSLNPAVPPETVGAIANAGGGCARVQGLWGSAVVMVASADKGVIRQGEVNVGDQCSGVTVRNAPK